MPANIDAFNAVTLDALGMLYALHPSKGDFAEADLSDTTRKLISEAGFEGDAAHKFWFDAVLWLEKEGYVRVGMKPLSGEYLGFVDLTSKGFQALAAVPSSLKGKAPLGQRIVETMRSAGGEVRTAAIGELVGAVFAGAMKSLG